jgi:hypothetical protein
MRRSIPILFAFVLMVFVGLQAAEPASAVKVVDYNVKYVKNTQHVTDGKYTWTTFQYNRNNLWIRWRVYEKINGKYVYRFQSWTQLKKISRTTLRIKEQALEFGWQYEYKHTHLTAARYYWRIYRPMMLS